MPLSYHLTYHGFRRMTPYTSRTILGLMDALEIRPGALAGGMATLRMLRLRLWSLSRQVSFHAVHCPRLTAEGFFGPRACAKENSLCLPRVRRYGSFKLGLR